MQVKRFIATGALLGILIGAIISFVFPTLLTSGAEFNRSSNTQLGLPDYSPKSGSILNSVMVFPMFLGIVGGAVGLIAYKLWRLK